MEEKKEYYRNLFRHITQMYPNGTWIESMKWAIYMGKPSKEIAISWEDFEPMFCELVEEYATEKGLTFSELTKLLL